MKTTTRTPMTAAEKSERAAKRAERKAAAASYAARMAAVFAEARAIVATRKCPRCGSGAPSQLLAARVVAMRAVWVWNISRSAR